MLLGVQQAATRTYLPTEQPTADRAPFDPVHPRNADHGTHLSPRCVFGRQVWSRILHPVGL
jgi:hypothetical protein